MTKILKFVSLHITEMYTPIFFSEWIFSIQTFFESEFIYDNYVYNRYGNYV
jgi:hypothetical protein